MSLADLFRCICKESECKEQGSILWSSNDGKYVHIRIDGCVIKSDDKKCDCLLMYFPSNTSKIIMFFIEVKGRSYSLSEVKEQIENTISIIESVCNQIKRRVLVPVCYAKSHPKDNKRFISSYRVKSSNGPLTIVLLNYGEDIKKACR